MLPATVKVRRQEVGLALDSEAAVRETHWRSLLRWGSTSKVEQTVDLSALEGTPNMLVFCLR